MHFCRKTTIPTFYSRLAALNSSRFRIRPSLLFRVWYFYVGFRSLPQKNCTIWTISKGYEIWINPCSQLFFLYSQIVQCYLNQNKKLHKQRHGEAPFALLSCHFLFLVHYTLFLAIWEISYKVRKLPLHEFQFVKATAPYNFWYIKSISPVHMASMRYDVLS